MITVYIILIDSFLLHSPPMIGPVYATQEAADTEVARLKAANSRTNARVTTRQLELP